MDPFRCRAVVWPSVLIWVTSSWGNAMTTRRMLCWVPLHLRNWGYVLVAALAQMLPSDAAFALSFTCRNTHQSFTNTDGEGTATGTIQSFAVPVGVSWITIDAAGAQGGDGYTTPESGGLGAEVTATVPVTPGQTLCVVVGVAGGGGGISSNGSGGGYGGGGGGGSFVYAISSGSCASSEATVTTGALPMLLIAAGGGGGGGATFEDLPGNVFSGDAAPVGNAPNAAGTAGASAGGGGEFGGGSGGTGGNGGGDSFSGGGLLTDGGGYALIHGSDGGMYDSWGGFGGGGGNAGINGGGGGGYNGGGGGSSSSLSPTTTIDGGGGGGGSYATGTLVAANTASGQQTGNGAVNVCLLDAIFINGFE